MGSFKEMNIKDKIIAGLKKDSITVPTDIQLKTIELAMDNKDIIAEAVTGSGKTLAYLLPSFNSIDPDSKELNTLVIAPTHELVIQINNVIKQLSKDSNHAIRSTTIIGNVNIKRQIENLKAKPHIIVGTPGRILELIKLKKIKAHQIKTVVIDEADKMLSDNNIKTVLDVIKTTLRDRQLLIFSAHINDMAIERALHHMKTPEIIRLDATKVNRDIEHLCLITEKRNKINTLRKVIHATKPKKTIVFINKNELIQEVVSKLSFHKIKVVGVFGNGTKVARKKAIDAFKGGKATVLIASDLVARGLDFKDITHVISLDLPVNLNEYTHRAGRTGRAGNKGTAISIITEQEIKALMKIEAETGIEFTAKGIYGGELVDYKED